MGTRVLRLFYAVSLLHLKIHICGWAQTHHLIHRSQKIYYKRVRLYHIIIFLQIYVNVPIFNKAQLEHQVSRTQNSKCHIILVSYPASIYIYQAQLAGKFSDILLCSTFNKEDGVYLIINQSVLVTHTDHLHVM